MVHQMSYDRRNIDIAVVATESCSRHHEHDGRRGRRDTGTTRPDADLSGAAEGLVGHVKLDAVLDAEVRRLSSGLPTTPVCGF